MTDVQAPSESASAEAITHPIVLFDGVCHFCHGAVRFIIERDPQGLYRFASLQSDLGQRLVAKHGLDAAPVSTMVLVEADRAYVKSAAALRVAKRLRMPWPLAYALMVVPARLRDGAYAAFAARRYRWFGQYTTCPIPPPGIRARFLD